MRIITISSFTYRSVLFTICLLITLNIEATTTTWIGGTGVWEKPSNWDTGNIPEDGDEVIIPNGVVTLNKTEEADMITVAQGATLIVVGNLELEYSSTTFINNGTVHNEGIIYFISSNTQSNGDIGLENFGTFTQEGVMFFEGSFYTSIKNYPNASFTNQLNIYSTESLSMGINNQGNFSNHEYIQIEAPGHKGISNTINGVFNNYGDIVITDIDGTGSSCLSTNATFINRSTGYINIYNHTSSNSASVASFSGGLFRNYGEMNITNTSNGIGANSGGTFRNERYASIILKTIDDKAINVGGVFRNRGKIDIGTVGEGIRVRNAFVVNHQSGIINIDNAGRAVTTDFGTAEFRNFGTMNLYKSDISIWNNSLFANRPMGRLYLEDSIRISTGTSVQILNQGHFTCSSNYTGEHFLGGTFTNTGILGDEADKFTSINNQSIRARPIYGTVTEGTPVSNALDVAGTNNVTVLAWYTSSTNTTSAGSYNVNTNTWTPNANAVGLTEVYVRVRVNTGGITRRYKVIIENGVQSSSSPLISLDDSNMNLLQEDRVAEINVEKGAKAGAMQCIKVYPNPISSEINIMGIEGNNVDIYISDTGGRIIHKSSYKSIVGALTVQRPDNTLPGFYFLTVMKDGKALDTERLVFIKL